MSCLSIQVPQASVANESVETGELPHCRESKSHFVVDARPSKGMHIKLQAVGMPQSGDGQFH